MRNVPGQPYCHSETLLFIPQTYTLSRQPSGSYPGSSDFSRISKSHYIPHDRIQPYSFVNLLLGKSLCFFSHKPIPAPNHSFYILIPDFLPDLAYYIRHCRPTMLCSLVSKQLCVYLNNPPKQHSLATPGRNCSIPQT